MKQLLHFFLLFLIGLSCQPKSNESDYTTWSHYGGGPEMIRYSSADQINRENVQDLELAWTYHSGGADAEAFSQIQCNPIVIDTILYGVSADMRLFAIHAESGREIWVFNPAMDKSIRGSYISNILINARGIAHWTDGYESRIFFSASSLTYSIDARTGIPDEGFGRGGYIDLREGLDGDYMDYFVVSTSPGIVYEDLLIMGTRVDEMPPSAPGHIRAYDVRTGEREWIFHTVPFPGEQGYETWKDSSAYAFTGGVNAWSGFSLDVERGLVFVPLGSASSDFYGGNRKGTNLFANCLVALDAASGTLQWHYQTIHHDVWDKDLSTPPALVTVTHQGKRIDAVAQPTKNGYLFLLDRESGKPIWEIKEEQVPTTSELPGEELHPTQPIPTLPKPFARQSIGSEEINPFIPEKERKTLIDSLTKIRHGSPYLPPGKDALLILPGYDGGAEWGGPSFDPENEILYVNSNEMAWVMEMVETGPLKERRMRYDQAGDHLYRTHCASCHRMDRVGGGGVPSIIDVNQKYSNKEIVGIIHNGQRRMPAFSYLSVEDKQIIADYVRDSLDADKTYYYAPSKLDSLHHQPFRLRGYNKFLTKDGLPAIAPPWGTMNAIDLKTGEHLWSIPFGSEPLLAEQGIVDTGAENYGGSVVTAGGLLIIAAAKDGFLRIFDKVDGKLLWKYKLPAPGFATPAVYVANGKQYIVIAAGGGKMGTNSSDEYLAFSLR